MLDYFTTNPIGTAALGAATAVGICAIAAGLAEGKIGSAAIKNGCLEGSNFGRSLILTVIPETIIILGFVIACIIVIGD